ncbi:Ldh family oxidoreductase [candidate division KSB3 bacterium]|uniref:Ldh family oxidoreductase n=1 Tax=candidate division KSB3 bacterium TaxID=2044937 RepID=A0A9D5JU27_9BACT|nr:Ldh family oxidoreductase [candidate division KSB3 bacterium]MBD3324170.1 Ldh family oxidoreductase [candidate division KSB3 bacterium]
MKGMYEGQRIPSQKLWNFCHEIFQKLGLPEDDAAIMANDLIQTDLRGVYSHGIMRLEILVKRAEAKVNAATPDIRVVQDHQATVLVDGDNGMGQVVSHKAMQIAIRKAKEFGISGVGVFNSNHNGTEANWAMMALEHEMIGFCFTTGGVNIMAPTGGYDRVLGNNPFAFAFPTGDQWDFPIVFDLACSTVARGWIVLAMKQGEEVPEGWALDKEGNPTTNAKEAYEGSVLPIGDYKGYGLSLIVGILSSVLTGGAIGNEVTEFYHDFERKQNIGHFMGAIDIGAFIPFDAFTQHLDTLITFIKASRKRQGVEKIYVPGEKEYETYQVNSKQGIPVPTAVLKEIERLAEKYAIDWTL